MTVEQLAQMHRAAPFRPFQIYLADGHTVDVQHPDLLARTPSGRTVVVARTDETFEVIDLLMVTSMQVLNGSPHRQRGRGKGSAG